MSKIAVVLGSIRLGRTSEAPARFVFKLAQEKGIDPTFLDLKEYNFRLFDDSPRTPSEQRWVDDVISHDAFVFVFPEYNHSPGSAFKNALDYLRKHELGGKVVGLVTVSDGNFGGVRAMQAARAFLPTFRAITIPTAVPIRLSKEFGNGEKYREPINRLLDELMKFVRLHRPG